MEERKRQRAEAAVAPVALACRNPLELLRPFGEETGLRHSGSDLQRTLMSAAACSFEAKCRDKSLEELPDKFMELHLNGQAARSNHSTLTALTGEKNLGRRMITLSSAVLEGSCYLLGLMLCLISTICLTSAQLARPFRPLLFVLRLRYDETPTKVRVEDPGAEENEVVPFERDCEPAKKPLQGPGSQQVADVVRDLQPALQSAGAAASVVHTSMMPVTATGHHSKILQVEMSVGLLLAQGNGDDARFHFISTQAPTALYALEKNNAQNIKQALSDCVNSVPELRRVSGEFKLRVRHSCTDRAGANFAAERLLQTELDNAFSFTHTPCDVHKLYSATKNGMAVTEPDVSGMLALALGTADHGAVTRMRQVLARILARRLVITFDSPPRGDVLRHQQQLWDLVLPVNHVEPARAKRNAKRRFILSYYLNGALWSKDIVHYCEFGCCCSPQQTLHRMCRYVCWALLPAPFPRFARSRWNGYDEALDAVTLLAGVHDLLSELVLEYTRVPRGASAAAELVDPVRQAPQAELAEGDDENKDAQVKKAHRYNAAQWVQTRPFERLALTRALVHPMMGLMKKFLQVAGERWEKKQQARAAKGDRRSYIMVEAAALADVDERMAAVSDLLRQNPAAVRAAAFTAALQEQRFVAVSSVLCSLHCLLRLPRSGYPYKLFSMLDEVDLEAVATDLLQAPVCMRDGLADAVLREFAPWLWFQVSCCSSVWTYSRIELAGYVTAAHTCAHLGVH